MNRHKKLGLVHKGARIHLSIVDFDKERTAYEDWIYSRTGQRSAKQLTEQQLDKLIGELMRCGALDRVYSRYDPPATLPTARQIAKIAAICKSLGWSGLDSIELERFAARTIHSPIKGMSRSQASVLITGLGRLASWAKSGAVAGADSARS